ncbi:MAG: UPF0182 family protein [Gemmatimonadaceae bacterium]|nr:UPF0182 family protein [Gemmatimonadaceae bacterium]
MRRSRAPLTVAIAIAVILFIVIPAAGGFFADLWWFRELNYQVVFIKNLTTRALLFLAAGGVASAVLFLNLKLAQRGVVPEPVLVKMGEAVEPVDIAGMAQRLRKPVSIFFGVFFGLGASATWDTVLQWYHRTPFGISDPIFQRDIGYYVFTLPALSVVLGLLSTLAFITLLAVVPVYFFRGDVVVAPRRLRIEPAAGVHLAILLAIPFVLTAFRLWFVDTSGLLYSTTGPLTGASYTDLHATLPAIRISAVLALVAAVVVLVGGARRQLGWYGFLAIGGYMAVAVIGRGVVPTIMQKFVVAPTELTREEPYLAHHVAATRHAWGIDSVESRDLEGQTNLTMASLRANAPTIDNVRLWDRAPLLRTFGQLQEIRTYYDFVNVDDDRYWIDGKYRQVLLAPRELNPESLPTRTFINEHLTFTHGMGLTMSPVNQVTTQGLPVLLIQDLPPASIGALKVSRPQIYYGELTNNYVFVGTRQREFDFPAGEENVYTTYTGTGGVTVGNIFRRSLLSLYFGSSKILLSGDITSESRVLYNRNIVGRVRKALPFLRLDRDPYMVVAEDGTLKWIQDAYTTTSRYPYSYRSPDNATYMRNSVKVVIDAYDGSLTAYVSAPNDPIIQTWSKVFPGIFVPLDSMSQDLRAHIRYPDDIFRMQTALYTTYHMDQPVDFYNREDQWQVPVVTRPDEAVPFMRHIIMRLPDEPEAEFIYMAPFTPRGKDNLAAWMVARNDGANYGTLRVYKFPRQSLIFGPRQIENRINQDTDIARQVSLWDQRGSEVIRGDLLVIPIDEALLYVQPLYLQAEGGRIPELKRVLVAYENQVVMRETLEQALQALFAGGSDAPLSQVVPAITEAGAPPAATGTASPELQQMVGEARRLYQSALDAQREGDWTRYGEEIRRLGELLERMGRNQ